MFHSLLTHPNSVFGQIERFRRDLDDAFGVSALPTSIRSVAPGTMPMINVGRTPKSIEVYVFAPGQDPGAFDVTFDRGILRIAGERKDSLPAENEKKVNVYTNERTNGRFDRAVALPEDVDPNQISADYKDGVLRVTIARREAVQPKRITVQ